MHTSSAHTVRRSFRYMIAAGMTALYLAIVYVPLASFAMHSAGSAPVVIRECSGDCNLCGCSPENRANHTCCCAKKRQQQAHVHEDDEDGTADCCKKKPVEKKTVIACGCPCGSGNQAALSTSSAFEVLPYHFTESFVVPNTETSFFSVTHLLTSRLSEPPDPPPKLV